MAAIDIIKNMSNVEIIKYYKYCMIERFRELKFQLNWHWHPTYEMNNIPTGKFNDRPFELHYSNEMFLLKEMWNRYLNSESFAIKCWWEAQRIFQIRVSCPEKEEPTTIFVSTKPAETLSIDTIEYNYTTYTFISSGSKRKVYASPDKSHVIKVPKDDLTTLGLEENITEARIYGDNENGNYAKCELLENGWLKMEYVKPAFFTKGDNYPEWTLEIAEHQVGYNNEGKLVAYDYGSEI